jgi:hypothetical protein
MNSGELSKRLDEAELKEEGDTATLTNKDRAQDSLKLKKVDGQWRVDLSSQSQQAPLIKSLGSLMGDVATEINDGKYKTVDEAQMAMNTKVMTALATMKRPTTAPATQPAK